MRETRRSAGGLLIARWPSTTLKRGTGWTRAARSACPVADPRGFPRLLHHLLDVVARELQADRGRRASAREAGARPSIGPSRGDRSVAWRLLRKGCGGRRRPGCERRGRGRCGSRPGAAVADRALGAGDVREPVLALARLCPPARVRRWRVGVGGGGA